MAKNIRGFLENLTDNFLNIILYVNFFGDLKSVKPSGPLSYIRNVRSLKDIVKLL